MSWASTTTCTITCQPAATTCCTSFWRFSNRGPQNRVSDRSGSPQEQEGSRRQGPQKQKGNKIVAEKQPSELPKARKHKSMDSDEDEEKPQNELGNHFKLSNPLYQYSFIIKDKQQVFKDQLSLTTLRMKTVSIAMNSVHYVRTPKGLFHQDLNVLTNDENWTMTQETQVCSSSRIILLCGLLKMEIKRTLQIDHYAVRTTFIVP